MTNTDINTAEVGDTISLEVEVAQIDNAPFDMPGKLITTPCGKRLVLNNLSSMVKEINKKPFDWDDVKPGMAFRSLNSNTVYWFIANNPEDDKGVILTKDPEVIIDSDLTIVDKDCVIRDAIHDVDYD